MAVASKDIYRMEVRPSIYTNIRMNLIATKVFNNQKNKISLYSLSERPMQDRYPHEVQQHSILWYLSSKEMINHVILLSTINWCLK